MPVIANIIIIVDINVFVFLSSSCSSTSISSTVGGAGVGAPCSLGQWWKTDGPGLSKHFCGSRRDVDWPRRGSLSTFGGTNPMSFCLKHLYPLISVVFAYDRSCHHVHLYPYYCGNWYLWFGCYMLLLVLAIINVYLYCPETCLLSFASWPGVLCLAAGWGAKWTLPVLRRVLPADCENGPDCWEQTREYAQHLLMIVFPWIWLCIIIRKPSAPGEHPNRTWWNKPILMIHGIESYRPIWQYEPDNGSMFLCIS